MNMNFRPATIEDARMLFDWRNDQQTRANSLTTDEVVWESHLQWLEKSLKNPHRKILIAEKDGVAIGTVRADGLLGNPASDGGTVELSWTVAPSERGKGLGREMVVAAAEMFLSQISSGEQLVAKIKMQNTASIKIAEAAGFVSVSEDEGVGIWIKMK